MIVLRALLFAVAALAIAWGSAALWFDGPAARAAAGALAAVFALASLGLVLGGGRRGRVGFALLFAVLLAWWLSIAPRSDRDWAPEYARTPTASFAGDRVTIRNVRHFVYRSETEFDPGWDERTLDLSTVTGVDFFLSKWGSPWIAHTIVSWTFEDAPPLAISIETRRERHETYSAVRGFFRQFELYYVVADERDVIGLRTNHRREDVYLYHLRTPADEARALLVDYLRTIDELAKRPRWYNALRHNCTTTIRQHAQHIAAGNPFDWRILVNGRIDELGYERGTVDTSLPFDDLRRRSAITARASAAPIDEDFSSRIREGLPRPSPTRRTEDAHTLRGEGNHAIRHIARR